MTENVTRFFERYETEPELKERVEDAVACYPGSLEIRESLAEAVLLPIAEELGLPFTVKDLRAYETRLKMKNLKPDEEIPEGAPIDEDPVSYWLLDKGWEYDTALFDKAKKKMGERG